ncbi:SLC13 family permease [Lactococcus lactis]|uniref:SLC13 family permease n=1 Tax=Lactococcus lactis TaxID=1358 RepID=UPI001F57E534|nr:SLC13 family permease [Lactococcus lactis]
MTTTLKRIFSDKTFLFTFALALLSLIFGTVRDPDIDLKTILALLSLIILISIFEILGILKYFAAFIIDKCQNLRQVALVVLLLSFFGSMFFTNDVAILTLVPIVFNIDRKVKLPKIGLISLMTIYANLGSAITPIGNPQNLYLVSYYHLKLLDFFKLSIPLGLVSLLTLFLCALLFSKKTVKQLKNKAFSIKKRNLYLLGFTTLIVLLGVLALIPVWISLIASLVCAYLIEKKVYQEVDYGIILTFINFFIIVGALGRIPLIHDWLHQLMNNDLSIFFTSILSSQVISNVPAAVLLSKFTRQLSPLYLGVTIGGLGTLVASLANLLALRQYQLNVKDKSTLKFFGLFTFLNFLYLLVFIGIGILFLR